MFIYSPTLLHPFVNPYTLRSMMDIKKGSRREHKVNICIRRWQGHPFWLPNPLANAVPSSPFSLEFRSFFGPARTHSGHPEWNPSSNYPWQRFRLDNLYNCRSIYVYKGVEWSRSRRPGPGAGANEQLPITTSFVNVSFEPFLSWRKYTMPFGTRFMRVRGRAGDTRKKNNDI